MILDIKKYLHYADNLDLNPSQKEELIRTVWGFMESSVDQAFGIHPVQQCCKSDPYGYLQIPAQRIDSEHTSFVNSCVKNSQNMRKKRENAMGDKQRQKAIIYCRVSSVKQVREGHGLNSQETRCREYARHKNYDVIEVFQDDGVSGSLIDRPGMRALLQFLKLQRGNQLIVIIDDISRLARGLEAHIQLRTAISNAGGKLESPSIEFGDDSDSQLVENLLASVSQHQRQKNGEQVKNRMRARVLNGYWVSYPAIGYRYEKVPGHGKMLVRNEPLATIVQAALEGFAHGRFETQTEVKKFLESHEAFPKGRTKVVHCQRAYNLLNQVLYTGYINLPGWGIHFHPGKHEPLISFDT